MTPPLLEARQLSKQFSLHDRAIQAVKEVSFSLAAGETLGLGGESGCGKSTLGKLLMGLIEPTSGSIFLNGVDLNEFATRKSSRWRREMQMIFQHPGASLDPRMTVEEALAEPFIIHRVAASPERRQRVVDLLKQVGLPEECLGRLPNELSGGQKQRVAIARALALNPSLLICDEPFSALDGVTQLQILDLLLRLQQERQLSYLVISHDLSALRYLSRRLAIMYLGGIVECGPTEELYRRPLHPYSQALAAAVLPAEPVRRERSRLSMLRGEVGGVPLNPVGCSFSPRCPKAKPRCYEAPPVWREVSPGHFTACHLYEPGVPS